MRETGHRFISDEKLLKYAKDLGLFPDHPPRHLLEYLEKEGLLTPVARVQFPGEIVRRWHKDDHGDACVPDPIEGETDRLRAATDLRLDVLGGAWGDVEFFGERPHPLDILRTEHQPFVQTDFSPSTFVPREKRRTVVELRDGKEVHDNCYYEATVYHYWHVFILASILRSGITIIYNVDDESIGFAAFQGKLEELPKERLYVSMNIEARHELRDIRKNSALFDAVAYFEAYRQNAFRKHIHYADEYTGRLPPDRAEEYLSRRRELAEEAAARYQIKGGDVLDFIKMQCELWDTARRRSPAELADEYANNIKITIALYLELTGKHYEDVVGEVGRVGGHFKPILKVIFPDWLEEQRELAERSLKNMVMSELKDASAPFTVYEKDVSAFCDWLEAHELFHLYWHFKRLVDLGFSDGPLSRTAVAAEAVGFANTVELMANAIIEERGDSARTKKSLPKKIMTILKSMCPEMVQSVNQHTNLTGTGKKGLRERLAEIDNINPPTHPHATRSTLKLIVIRNEGSHLGLGNFERHELFSLIGDLVRASVVLWKAR